MNYLQELKSWLETRSMLFWVIVLAVILVLLAIAVVIVIARRRKNPFQDGLESHGVCCGFGELKDVLIPLRIGQDIIIGSDKNRCNYVAYEDNIEKMHCRIRYLGNDCYEVTNYSREGILIDGKRVVSGTGVSLAAGSKIVLAAQYEVSLL